MAYGFLPAGFYVPFSGYNGPNSLLISYQDCTACPDWIIEKGNLVIPPEIAAKYHNIIIDTMEFNLANCGIIYNLRDAEKNLWDENTKFLVTGRVVGADSNLIAYGGDSDKIPLYEMAPRFHVQSWTSTSYCATFWGMNIFIKFLWVINLLCLTPLVFYLGFFKIIRSTPTE